MAARSLNKVILIGNLTRDPELRYTPQGTPVCSFGIDTNREWMDNSGQKQEDVEFHNTVAWNKLAEICANLLFKGRKVYVEGRLSTRTWSGQDGAERKTTEVVIDEMIAFGQGKQGQEEEFGGGVDTSSMMPEDNGDGIEIDAPDADDKQEEKKDKEDKDDKKSKKEGKDLAEEVADDIPF